VLVQEYIDGEDLAAHFRRRGPLPLLALAPILRDVAAALDAAHAAGVVHRDVKPSNIMLEGAPDRVRRAVLMDFGVALSSEDRRLTQAGNIIGTLDYIAPEQVRDAARVDGRADVYALAATVFHLVAGRPPFVERTPLAMVMAHLRRPPPPPSAFAPALSPAAERALLAALQKHPGARPATASAFVDALYA
jgi:serine/threonine-protein kinase